MSQTLALSPRIIEGLYHQALVLSDEVRATFALSRRNLSGANVHDSARIALSAEALRATTRMLHAVAWLLNHREYYNGMISEFQLRRCGPLPKGVNDSDEVRLSQLPADIHDLIAAIDRFYARLVRLEGVWNGSVSSNAPAASHSYLDSINSAMG